MPAKRIEISLSETQWKAVEERAHRLGISAAEVIRQAIDESLAERPSLDDVLGGVAGD